MIRAVIFDLDYCLFPTSQVPLEVYAPALQAVIDANRGRLSEEALERAFSDAWRHPIDDVARRHGFSEEMLSGAWRGFAEAEVTTPMAGYPDRDVLARIPARRFLVTSGFERLQHSKVRALGLEHVFDRIYIDVLGDPARRGKEGVFRDILAEYDLQPAEVIVVGDNPESEIAAGNRLGLHTVQILRPTVLRGANAQHYVEDLHALLALLTHLG